jgi:hypothetical protein
MSKSERAALAVVARKRAKLSIAHITERTAAMQAEIEDQLAAQYAHDDALWADVTKDAMSAIADLDRRFAAKFEALGVPDHLRASAHFVWANRGENASATSRTELRRKSFAEVAALAATARRIIEARLLDVETELIRGGLESGDAHAFLAAMPSAEELMPSLSIDGVDRGERRWEPPIGLVAELLTPTTATGREAKRDAIAGVLAAMPEASNREVGRIAGVDHHTVAAARLELVGNSPTSPATSPPTSPPNSPEVDEVDG